MPTKLYRIDLKDLAKGIIVAVIAGVLTTFLAWLNSPGFSLSSIDWSELVRVALASGVGYLIKNFFTNEEGKVFGAI